MKDENQIDVTEISVTTGMTVNIGNYESVKLEASIKLKKNSFHTKQELYNYAWSIVEEEVYTKALKIKEDSKKR